MRTVPIYGGGAAETTLHPIVLAALVIAGILILLLPRNRVIIPLLGIAFLVPIGQQLYIAGVHVFALRMVILLGLVRVFVFPKSSPGFRLSGGWNEIDTAFTLYVFIQTLAFILRYPEAEAIVNQAGSLWDMLGGYFLLRALIHSESDAYTVIKCLACLSVVFAVTMTVEELKLTNVFGMLGGVRAVPELREGRARAQGVFQHALTAGTFATTLLPLLIILWKNAKSRLLAALALVSVTIMTFSTQTSTSVMSYVAAVAALFAWPIRKRMRAVRWGFVAGVLVLNLVMKAPVWYIIAHIDVTGASSSWQRAALIDAFVRHFGQWWLMGTDTDTWGWSMWDVQNQYVAAGVGGGLAAFVAFILIISRSFSRLGIAMKAAKGKRDQWLLWVLGSALFVDVVAFIGVNFFDQVRIIWFAVLAMLIAVTVTRKSTETASAAKLTSSTEQGELDYAAALSLGQKDLP